MLASYKPFGARIVRGDQSKVKGSVILQGIGEWPYWATFWTDWPWTRISRSIDNLATIGVNCLQITATGLPENGVSYPSDADMRTRITQLAKYAASKGMTLNPQFGWQPVHTFANGATAATAAAVRMAKLFMEQQNISSFDAINEVNLSPAPGWNGNDTSPNSQALSDISAFNSGLRAVIGGVPMTFSVACDSPLKLAGAWSEAMAAFSDFHNVHTYWWGGAAAPTVEDFASLRAASWYLGRFIVGETGVPSLAGEAKQTSWLTGNGVIARLPDCVGSIQWGSTDTTGPGVTPGFGLMDSSGIALRPALAVPISNWPGAV